MSNPPPRAPAAGPGGPSEKTDKTGDPWLYWPAPRARCRMRLFCFPHAGGSPLAFRRWPAGLPADVEVAAIRLPGRDVRIKEAPLSAWEPLLAAVEEALVPYLDRPFALFGHSLGASIAYEITRRLAAHGRAMPAHLLVSGRRAPHVPARSAPIHGLPRDRFFEQLRLLHGTPAEVLANQEIMDLVEPMLRADIRLAEIWTPATLEPLPLPITGFCGTEDVLAPPPDVQAWAQHTTRAFAAHVYPGHHFFVQTSEAALLRAVARILLLA